jgi:dihydroorotase
VGLESALSVVQAAVVDTGMLDWADVVRIMSTTPARIGRLTSHGQDLAAGANANVVLVDPSASRPFGVADLAGKGINSPYLGRTLPGRVQATFHLGEPTVLDGAVLPAEAVSAGVVPAQG